MTGSGESRSVTNIFPSTRPHTIHFHGPSQPQTPEPAKKNLEQTSQPRFELPTLTSTKNTKTIPTALTNSGPRNPLGGIFC